MFNFIENPYRPVSFDYLLVSPQNSRRLLYDMIDKEIANAQKGLSSGITLKLNNPGRQRAGGSSVCGVQLRRSGQSVDTRYVLTDP